MRYRYLLLLSTILISGCDGYSSGSRPTPPVGRFVIVHSPHVRADTMLLDTATGQTWVAAQGGKEKDSASVWTKVEMIEPLPVINSN